MNKLYLYLALLTAAASAHAQNIYNGGISDGSIAQNLGPYFYTGGSGNGFGFTSYTAPTNPLPLTFLSFTGQPQGNAVTLHWQTANAVNVDHFDIERSANAGVFQDLTSVAATTNNSNTQNYQALDPSPVTGTNDYRLKEVDVDGQFQYSNIVRVTFGAAAATEKLSLFPNPASNSITIDITLPAATRSVITIYNSSGQPVVQQQAELPQGTSSFTCPIGALAAGQYFVKVQGPDLPVASFLKQ